MFAEQASFPILFLLQDAPPVSPALLIIIAILLVILFIWLLLRERRSREAAGRQEAERMAVGQAKAETAAAPSPAEKPPADKPPTEQPPAGDAANVAIDDLEVIEGIGPKIAGVLKQAGVTSFSQLAAMDAASISAILEQADLRLANPESWPEQARLAAAGDMVGLKALQDNLKAGRQG